MLDLPFAFAKSKAVIPYCTKTKKVHKNEWICACVTNGYVPV